jgi:hypothetical protein
MGPVLYDNWLFLPFFPSFLKMKEEEKKNEVLNHSFLWSNRYSPFKKSSSFCAI